MLSLDDRNTNFVDRNRGKFVESEEQRREENEVVDEGSLWIIQID